MENMERNARNFKREYTEKMAKEAMHNSLRNAITGDGKLLSKKQVADLLI